MTEGGGVFNTSLQVLPLLKPNLGEYEPINHLLMYGDRIHQYSNLGDQSLAPTGLLSYLWWSLLIGFIIFLFTVFFLFRSMVIVASNKDIIQEGLDPVIEGGSL